MIMAQIENQIRYVKSKNISRPARVCVTSSSRTKFPSLTALAIRLG